MGKQEGDKRIAGQRKCMVEVDLLRQWGDRYGKSGEKRKLGGFRVISVGRMHRVVWGRGRRGRVSEKK